MRAAALVAGLIGLAGLAYVGWRVAARPATPAAPPDRKLAAVLAGITPGTVRAELEAVVGVRHYLAAPANLDRTADWIQERLAGYGYKVENQRFSASGVPGRNVIARRIGTSAPGEVIVVGAHYDSVPTSPGADDNASGVAGLLEVARVLSRLPTARTIVLAAYTHEELGFLGSIDHVSRLVRDKADVRGAFILEMIGYASSKPGSQKRPEGLGAVSPLLRIPDTADFLGVAGNRAARPLKEALEQAAASYEPGFQLIGVLIPGRGNLLPAARLSDNSSFWDADMPAVMITDTSFYRNPHYHEPSDTIDTLDLAFLARSTRVVAAAVLKLANAAP